MSCMLMPKIKLPRVLNVSSFTIYTVGKSGFEVFEDWARSRGKKGAPARPPSRGRLPALPQPKARFRSPFGL